MGPKKSKKSVNRALLGLQPVKKQKRSELSAAEKLTVLDWHQANGNNQVRTANHFRAVPGFETLNQGTISRWVRDEESIRLLVQSGKERIVRQRGVHNEEHEKCMALWVEQMEACEFRRLTGEAIRQVAIKFYEKLDVPVDGRLELSNGWLARFLERHGLSLQVFHDEASSTQIALVDPERQRVSRTIDEFLSADAQRTLRDVWNVDETPFFYAQTPDRGLSRSSRPGVKQNKTRITLALAANASRDERLDPLYVGKWEKPRCFERRSGRDLGFQYAFNSTAWMTKDIFSAWLSAWNAELAEENRHVLLLLDNFSGHKVKPVSNIELFFFSPNLIAYVQPCDGGVIRAFKALYRRYVVLHTVDRLFSGEVTADLFKIDQLSATRLARQAWQGVTEETIANCWKHVGVLPGSRKVGSNVLPEDSAIQDLEQALQLLKFSAGSVGHSLVLMDASTFVDLDRDEPSGVQLTVDEIVQTVQKSVEDASDSSSEGKRSESNEDSSNNRERLSPEDVYKPLMAVERYCEEKELAVSDEAHALFRKVRRELQVDILSGKRQKKIHDFFKPA